MPAIDVYYRRYAFREDDEEEIFGYLKNFLADRGAAMFSTDDFELTFDDFTIMFHEAGQYDVLTHDVIVRIQLHAFPQRLVDTDGKAAELATGLAKLLKAAWLHSHTIGVSLLFAEIGWGTAKVAP